MRRFGAPLAFLEMINVRALSYKNKKSEVLLAFEQKDRPLGIQLLGREEKFILKALEIVHRLNLDIIDFNAACPVRKVVRRGEGASLLKEPKKLFNLLKLIRKNTSLPLSVKLRTGWEKNAINAPELGCLAQDAGVDCIFIHGRTREQFYTGQIDYETIRKVKKAVSLPVVASGNILSAPLAKKMLDETGCDGLLLARGALGNPWLLKEISTFLKNGALPKQPTLNKKIKVILEHLNEMINFYGEKRAIIIFRKFLSWYLKGTANACQFRNAAYKLKSKRELIDLLKLHFPAQAKLLK